MIFVDVSNIPFNFNEALLMWPDCDVQLLDGNIHHFVDNLKEEWYKREHMKGTIVYDLRFLH